MGVQPRFETWLRFLGFLGISLCGVGAVFGMIVVLFRLPVLANNKLDLLFGTLQGVTVSLLFAIAALLINLTIMIRRAIPRLPASSSSARAQG